MTAHTMDAAAPACHAVRRAVGFVPQAVAVMGKWEPYLRQSRCLDEVEARAAAALTVAEALAQEGTPPPMLLCAEAWLRRQPKPGCFMAADLLMQLGAAAEQIRCCPAANHTAVELLTLDRMCHHLGLHTLLLITGRYHVRRTESLLAGVRQQLGVRQAGVMALESPLLAQARELLPPRRSRQLAAATRRGSRTGWTATPALVTEFLATLSASTGDLQAWLASVVRGGQVDWRSAPIAAPLPTTSKQTVERVA